MAKGLQTFYARRTYWQAGASEDGKTGVSIADRTFYARREPGVAPNDTAQPETLQT